MMTTGYKAEEKKRNPEPIIVLNKNQAGEAAFTQKHQPINVERMRKLLLFSHQYNNWLR